MKKRLRAASIAAGLAAAAVQAQAGPLTQYGDVLTGLAFNEVTHVPPSTAVTEIGNSYSYMYRTVGSTQTRLYDLPPLTSLADLGQFRYEMFYDPTRPGNGSAGSMSQIDWHNGTIVFLPGDPIDFYSAGTTTVGATLRVLGGEFQLAKLSGQQANNVEDLPFDLGVDVPLTYEITGNSFFSLQLELKNGLGEVTNTLAITLTPNNLNISRNDPFNAVVVDPTNGVAEDIAFFVWDWTSSFSCSGTTTELGFADACGPFGAPVLRPNGTLRRYDQHEFGLRLAGWGRSASQDVPEPATLLLFGLGAFGLGVARRRPR